MLGTGVGMTPAAAAAATQAATLLLNFAAGQYQVKE